MSEAEGELRFEDSAKAVRYWTRRLYAGVAHKGVQLDDVRSEVMLVWVLCRDGFDPKMGASFATYFSRAVEQSAFTIYRRLCDPTLSRATSLSSADDGDNAGEMDLASLPDLTQRSPEAAAINSEAMRRVSQRAPLLGQMLRLCEEEPVELLAELRAAAAHKAWADEHGLVVEAPPTALTPRVLSRIFDFNWRWHDQMCAEIDKVAAYVE